MVFPIRDLARASLPTLATLASSSLHRLPSQLYVAELFFDVPLDYSDPTGEKIRLFGRAAFKYERPAAGLACDRDDLGSRDVHDLFTKQPWLAYLEGGPGAGNREPQDLAITRLLINRGYQLLFLDYRGTGLSSPITAATLRLRGAAQAQADYLRLFRADNIVRDLEAVRQYLTADLPPNKRSWSVLGQSFGGFVSMTYLSFRPEGLREVFLTGGLAPVDTHPDDVYRATYRRAIERNEAFFAKFPEDRATLRQIGHYLNRQPDAGNGAGVPLPAGGTLTLHRVMTFGYLFGFHGGLDQAHTMLLRLKTDMDRFGFLTRPTLVAAEQYFSLDVMPLYGLLHEPIYCFGKGVASRWSAHRVASEYPPFRWVAEPTVAPDKIGDELYLSGEMIYPFMFDTYPELQELKAVANLLADYDEWDALYDAKQLAANKVPVYAASYIHDLYVDYELARETAKKVRNTKVFETNRLYHNAVRAQPSEVIANLFQLRDDTID